MYASVTKFRKYEVLYPSIKIKFAVEVLYSNAFFHFYAHYIKFQHIVFCIVPIYSYHLIFYNFFIEILIILI